MPYRRIAHRGASGTRPELTRAAFERAIELGADMIELDVQLTRDRQLVVLHDEELGRTVRAQGLVREWTLADLCALDAGGWFDPAYAGERVPSLADVLDLTAGRVQLNVEVKSTTVNAAETADALLTALARADRLAGTLISAFEMEVLHCVRARSAHAQLAVLWENTELGPAWAAATALRATAFHPCWPIIDAAAVAEAHRRGLAVYVWTVNEPTLMRQMLDLGVDGVMSDFPERLPAAV